MKIKTGMGFICEWYQTGRKAVCTLSRCTVWIMKPLSSKIHISPQLPLSLHFYCQSLSPYPPYRSLLKSLITNYQHHQITSFWARLYPQASWWLKYPSYFIIFNSTHHIVTITLHFHYNHYAPWNSEHRPVVSSSAPYSLNHRWSPSSMTSPHLLHYHNII